MSIIARRIPSGLGYLPNTTVRAHTVRGGLGVEEQLGWFMPAAYAAAASTPTAPVVDANTLPLCSVTPKFQPCRNYIGGSPTYSTGAAQTPLQAPTPTKSTDWGAIASSLSSMFAPKPAPTPAPTPAASPAMAYMPPASSGMSKGTMIAIGLGAAGLLAVVMLSRK